MKLNGNIRLTQQARALAEERIYPELPLTGYKLLQKLRAVEMYIAEVMHRDQQGKAVQVSRNKATLRNHRVQLEAQYALLMRGLVEVVVGFYDPRRGRGDETQYTPTDKLRRIFAGLSDAECTAYRPGEIIVLKDEHKSAIPIPDDLDPAALEYLFEREWLIGCLNAVNERHTVTYRVWDQTAGRPGRKLGRTLTGLRAIYNNGSFHQGGRLYGEYQNLRKDERRTMRIDGESTVELDYACLHAAMLYNSGGLPLPGDAYALYDRQGPGLRAAVKVAFNALLNAKTRQGALGGCNLALSDYDETGRLKSDGDLKSARAMKTALAKRRLKFKDVLAAVVEKHHAIRSHFGSGIGLRLQNQDVELVYRVCSHFCSQGVPVLPVHDSFNVQRQHAGELRDVMRAAYHEQFGFEPLVR